VAQTIITTALPTISTHFQSSAGYTWIGSAYLLGAASSTPVWAKFSDIFGRKPILMVANVCFFVGSLVAALSYNIGMLIAARTIQGIGGGGLISLVNISIGDLFSMRYVLDPLELTGNSADSPDTDQEDSTMEWLDWFGPSPVQLDPFWAESLQKK
jgi:MFS family permease